MALDYTKMVSQYQQLKDEEDKKKLMDEMAYSADTAEVPVKKGGFFSNLARNVAKTPLKFVSTAETALTSAGQLLTGQSEKAAHTAKYGSERVRKAEKQLGYEEGEISSPYKVGVDIEEQKERGMFGKETVDMFGAGAELASYGMGAPAAKTTWTSAKTAGVPLTKLAYGAAKREVMAGIAGAMGYAAQEDDATVGSVVGSGLIGGGLGFATGAALPFASKAWTGLKSWNKAADEAMEQALSAQTKQTKRAGITWDKQPPPPDGGALPGLDKPLAEIDDDLFPVMSERAKPVAEPLKKEAKKVGFKDWQVNIMSEMSPEEHQSVSKMMSLAQEKSQNILAKSPVDEAAKPIVEQMSHLQKVRKTSGAALDDLVDEMPDEAISLAEPANRARSWLENAGIAIKQNENGAPVLDFSSSKFSTSVSNSDRKVITEAFNEIFPARGKMAESFRTPKETRVIRQRLKKMLDSQMKASEPFSGETETFIGSLRTELQKPLADLSPAYAEASKNYAISTNKLKNFYKFLGKDFYDASDEDVIKRIG